MWWALSFCCKSAVDFQPHWWERVHYCNFFSFVPWTGQATKDSFVVFLCRWGKSFIWAPMKEIYPQGSMCLAPSASAFPLLHVKASNKSIQSDFFLFICAALVIVEKIQHLKWARHTAPILEPMGTISVVVPKQSSMEWGAKIGSSESTNWDLKISANF